MPNKFWTKIYLKKKKFYNRASPKKKSPTSILNKTNPNQKYLTGPTQTYSQKNKKIKTKTQYKNASADSSFKAKAKPKIRNLN